MQRVRLVTGERRVSADVRDRIRDAAEGRDRYALRELARYDRYEAESYMRHESRSDLTPGEREYASEVFEDAGMERRW